MRIARQIVLLCAIGVLSLQAMVASEIRIALRNDPKTFDPFQADDDASNTLRYLTAGSLVRIDRGTQRIVPRLAESWTVLDGGKRVRFHVRKDARFSDGAAITPGVVAASVTRLFAAEHSPVADAFGAKPVSVVANDKAGVVDVAFGAPIVNLLALFDEVAIVPSGANSAKAATSGMYTVQEYRPGEYVLLQRNPFYPAAVPEQVRLSIQKGREVEVARFLNRELDILNTVDPDSYERIHERDPKSAYDGGASFDSDFMWFNLRPTSPVASYKREWFANKEFRNAVSAALNRDDIARIAYRGFAQPAIGPVSPSNTVWFNRKLQVHKFDPDGALQRLRGEGFENRGGRLFDKSGHPVTFTLMTNAGNRSREMAATLIQQDLKKIGIEVTVVTLDFPSLLERMTRSFDYEACLLGFTNVDAEPMAQMNVWLSSAENHPWNPAQAYPATTWEAEIDRLMRVQASSIDAGKRKAAFDRVQEIVYEQEPFIYLVNKHSLSAVSTRVQGAKVVSVWPQAFWNIESLRVAR